MNGKKIITTLMLSTLLFSGCGVKNNYIIKVNDGGVTMKEYNQMMDKAIAQAPYAKMGLGDLKGNKDGFLYLMTEQRVINQLIIQELLEQEAQAREIKVTNQEVDEAVKELIDKMGGKDLLTKTLRQNGVSVADFKKDVKNQVKMEKLANAYGKINITDNDCKKYYTKNPDKFKHGNQVRASHILISANPYQIQEELKANSKNKLTDEQIKAEVEKVMADKKAEAEKLANELKADNSKFAQYAKKYSDDEGSAVRGGDLGFFAKDKMVPEFANAAFSAKPNTVTDPVKSQFGYHIIMVTDRREAGIVPYEKVKNDIKDFLTSEKQIVALDEIIQAAKKKSKIEYLDERYNPDVIGDKLHKQVNDATNGAADKVKNQKNKK